MVTSGIELPTADGRCRIAAALPPDSLLDVCREQLRSVEPQVRRRWRYCQAIEALYHPERYVRVAYVLLADAAIRPERYWPKGDIVYLHWPARRPISRRGTLIRIGGCDVEAYCFPNDRRLRGLRKLTGRTTLARLWQSWIERSGTPAQVDSRTLRRVLIRYVPEHKFVARLQARALREQSDDADGPSIAVRASSPETCQVLARRHRIVAGRARKASKFLYVPDAVVADAAGGLVAVEWVPGRSLLEKLETGEFTTVMRRMARTLRSFHRLPAAGLERLLPHDVYRPVENAVSDLGSTCPDLKSRLTVLASELRERLEEVGDVEPATLHNDLHWDQMRIRRKRYAVLDLDRMCLGDPLIDVANFTTQVRMLGHRPEHNVNAASATRWAGEFLEQWASAVGRPVAPRRFRLYAAVSLLRLARGMMRHLRPGWRALARRCVEQAEAELSSSGREVVVA
ncbi:MAG: phosphotransferase family protein [Phycisphaerae bacterium]